MASASGYNYHRFARAVLKKARKWEPSLSIQLYPTHWRFENSEINFLYDGPMKPFLLALRAQVIPAALIPFLYDIRPPVSFVDGCLVVELQDFRKVPEVRSRVVMRPAPETLPMTIDIMLARRHENWEDNSVLELESRIMAATSAPLYLGTSILATRNAALSLALTAPAEPNMAADGTTRPALTNGEEEVNEFESMRKLMGTGTRSGGAFQPNWSILRLKERLAAHAKQKEAEAAARAAGARAGGPQAGADGNAAAAANPAAAAAAVAAGASVAPAPGTAAAAAAAPATEEKKKSKKKRPAPAADTATEDPPKPSKKKKASAAAAAAAAAAKAEEEEKEKEKPKKKDAPKKKKAAPKKDKEAK